MTSVACGIWPSPPKAARIKMATASGMAAQRINATGSRAWRSKSFLMKRQSTLFAQRGAGEMDEEPLQTGLRYGSSLDHVPGAREQLLEGSLRDHLPMIDDGELIAELLRLVHVVGGVEHRHARSG